jgi:hypothetical protein
MVNYCQGLQTVRILETVDEFLFLLLQFDLIDPLHYLGPFLLIVRI